MKIKAIPCTGKDLKSGDLFSTAGPAYWDHYQLRQSIGEKVYIRTDVPSDHADDADAPIYRIEIEL